MKTVQNTKGKIERVDNDTAFNMVQSGDWEYIPKHVWKKEVRDKYKQEDEVKEVLGTKKKKGRLTRKEKRIINQAKS